MDLSEHFKCVNLKLLTLMISQMPCGSRQSQWTWRWRRSWAWRSHPPCWRRGWGSQRRRSPSGRKPGRHTSHLERVVMVIIADVNTDAVINKIFCLKLFFLFVQIHLKPHRSNLLRMNSRIKCFNTMLNRTDVMELQGFPIKTCISEYISEKKHRLAKGKGLLRPGLDY